jgi:gliding motility-associated-like protein
MNRSILLLLFIVVAQCVLGQAWLQKASLPSGGGLSPVYFTINGKIYVGGGYYGALSSDFYEYEPATDVWTKKTNLPVVIYSSASFVLDGEGYVVCGNNGSVFYNSVFRYNPYTDVWETLNQFPGAKRMACIGFVVNNTAFVCGGYFGGGGVTGETWQYNKSNDSWIQKTSIPGPPRNHPSFFVINDTAYVGLACDAYGNQYYDDMYRYNPALDSWTPIAVFPSKRFATAGYSINGMGYIACGHGANGFFTDLFEYNPTKNEWKEMCVFGGGKRSHVLSLAVNGKAYVGCGTYPLGSFLNDFWVLEEDSLKADFTAIDSACSSTVVFQNNSTGYQSLKWHFGDGDSGTLENPVHTYSGLGKYTVTLSVSNACRTETKSIEINVGTSSSLKASFDVAATPCSYSISLINASINASAFQWDFGDGNTSTDENPQHTYASRDSFVVQLIATNNCGVDSINKVFIPDIVQGVANFDVSVAPCSQDIIIENKSTNGFTYLWRFGDNKTDSSFAPKHTYLNAGTYNVQLIVNQSTLCESEMAKVVTLIEEQGGIMIPNVFSPNADKNNDIFEIIGVKDCLPFELTIFNRWGEMVFKSTDRKIGWDGFYKGKPQPAGVYAYMLNATGKKYKGSVTLIR